MAHQHSHAHLHNETGVRLRNAFFLTLIVLLIELVAGSVANSLALLSDAAHILTDAFALALAWFATRMEGRAPTERNTFGYRRGGILTAMANAGVLILIAAAILAEAVIRARHPQHVTGVPVVIAASLAIIVNSYIAFGLHTERAHSLNVRATFLHVTGDLAASVGVVLAGFAILIWHAYLVDPILSAAIAILIAVGAWNIVRDTVTILMEGTPRDVELDRVRAAIREVPGVQDVHDLHVWALSDGFRLLTAHAGVEDQSLAETSTLVADIKMLLQRRFGIEHATIELECRDCRIVPRRPIRLHRNSSAVGASEDPGRPA